MQNTESEKWKLNHENLDLKQDLDSLISFINTAKRTGRWDPKKLQLKTIAVDRIIGFSAEEASIAVPLHKEIQYRDERIQVLQSEIEHLRKAQAELITKQVESNCEEKKTFFQRFILGINKKFNIFNVNRRRRFEISSREIFSK